MRTTPRRWWVLSVVSLAQLMVVLDSTIVNIALPSAQRELGMSDADRHWVITAYALAFGGLLLLGGRISSAVGHRRTFSVSLCGFAAASVLGGLAATPGMLFGARALQGVFAAALAPAALSLLTTTFTDPRDRGRAFGVFAAVAAGGSALGLIVGGLFTEYADWRWCLYVNVPLALLTLLGVPLVERGRATGAQGMDLGGVVLSVAGLVLVVYASNQAQPHGWTDPMTLAMLVGGLGLLVLFVVWESRTRLPLLPMRLLLHRERGAAFLTNFLMQVTMFGFYLFMSYYTQGVLDYSPVQAGSTIIVTALAATVGSLLIAGRLLGRVPPGVLIVPGLLAAAAGMLILTQLPTDGSRVFVAYLLPAQLLIGLGMGCVMTPTASLATTGIGPADVGVASATYNAMQQLGAALGTALLNTVATTVVTSYLLVHRGEPLPTDAATVHGYTTALTVGVGILVVAAVIGGLLLTGARLGRRRDLSSASKPGGK